MSKKLEYSYVREQFELRGYTLLSTEYENSSVKLKYLCPNGHQHSISWDHFKEGKRCPFCSGRAKPSLEEIRLSFVKRGWSLLDEKYIDNKTPMSYICDKGHTHQISWSNFKLGKGCPYCKGLVPIKFEEVRAAFVKEGYTLTTHHYINTRQKLEYVCPKGHVGSMSYGSFKRGHRCLECSGRKRKNIIEVKEIIEKEGYTLITKEYNNNQSELKVCCPNGHTYTTSWALFQEGVRCKWCQSRPPISITIVEEALFQDKYRLVRSFRNKNGLNLEVMCPRGHLSIILWSNWCQGKRCNRCSYLDMSGPNHWNWKGGASCEPYCQVWSDKEYKRSIRYRDKYVCRNPYCYGGSRRLVIHHIDYNKKNCAPSNLITVCASCNSKANKEREWHEEWYHVLMNKLYGYNY